jgi:hypothetical protein
MCLAQSGNDVRDDLSAAQRASLAMTLPAVFKLLAVPVAVGAFTTWVASSPLGGTMQIERADRTGESPKQGNLVLTQGWLWDFFSGGSRRDGRVHEGGKLEPAPEPKDRVEERRGEERWQGRSVSGTYRTLCVRLCDGFYWPISHATTHSRFRRDANRCEQSCPGRSRLFVHSHPDQAPEDMVDLEGQPYRKLDNAFRHQREYVSTCTCRGHPWEQEAIARHRAYAEASKTAKERLATGLEQPAVQKDAFRRERRAGRAERWARRAENNDD